MPTKLSSTLSKSDTQSSNMLCYKFTKDAFGKDNNNSSFLEYDDYQFQLKSLQDTMKAIREMEDEGEQS